MTDQMLPLAAADDPNPVWQPKRSSLSCPIEARRHWRHGTSRTAGCGAKATRPSLLPAADISRWRIKYRLPNVLCSQTTALRDGIVSAASAEPGLQQSGSDNGSRSVTATKAECGRLSIGGDDSTAKGAAVEPLNDFVVLDTLGEPIPVGAAEVAAIDTYLGNPINDVLAGLVAIEGPSADSIARDKAIEPCPVHPQE